MAAYATVGTDGLVPFSLSTLMASSGTNKADSSAISNRQCVVIPVGNFSHQVTRDMVTLVTESD